MIIKQKHSFHHTLAESTTYCPGSKTRKWYFWPGHDEIVYYTRDVKSWPVQCTCKLANMCSGMALFIPMLRIQFFIIPGLKIPHSRFGARSESGTFGQGMVKNSIRTMNGKLASTQLVFTTLVFGSGGNLHELWTVQIFPVLGM